MLLTYIIYSKVMTTTAIFFTLTLTFSFSFFFLYRASNQVLSSDPLISDVTSACISLYVFIYLLCIKELYGTDEELNPKTFCTWHAQFCISESLWAFACIFVRYFFPLELIFKAHIDMRLTAVNLMLTQLLLKAIWQQNYLT